MSNLYTFSKNSWHCKFFSWLYGINPTKEFKTMCPYFWTLVLTFIFLPLVLIIRMFGKSGQKVLEFFRTCKQKNEEKRKKAFIKKAESITTSKEAYYFRLTSYYEKNGWCFLDWKEQDRLRDLAYKYKVLLWDKKSKKKEIISNKTKAFKENIVTKIILNIIVVSAIVFLLYFLILLISKLVSFLVNIDWNPFLEVLPTIGLYSLIGIISIALIWFVIFPALCNMKKPDFSKLEKLAYILYIFYPLLWLGKGFIIIVNMLYATYKQYCPMITWKE